MTWAKIDTAFHRNPKVRMAGRNARDVYFFVLLVNAERAADGELNALVVDPDYLADQLQCSVEDARDGVAKCETFHLLHVDEHVLTICGWDDEWKVATSTDRVRKYRQKKKQAVADNETGGNVSAVSCNGETAREIDREREREKDSIAHRADAPSGFDFAAVYAAYPRKVGKTRGLSLCASKVKTQAKYDTLLTAAQEMGRLWRSAKKDRKGFCPQFDTWMSKGRWLDPEQIGPDGESKAPGELTIGEELDKANEGYQYEF